jgi:hypothetical protein
VWLWRAQKNPDPVQIERQIGLFRECHQLDGLTSSCKNWSLSEVENSIWQAAASLLAAAAVRDQHFVSPFFIPFWLVNPAERRLLNPAKRRLLNPAERHDNLLPFRQ